MVVKICSCGIEYNTNEPLKHLGMINVKLSSGYVLPCTLCIETIISNTMKKSKTCFVCKSELKTVKAMKEHIFSHHLKSVPYKCELCDKVFKAKTYLQIHQFRLHFHNKQKCAYCDKFFRKSYVKKHVEIFHSKNPPTFLCSLCGIVFHTKPRYDNHWQAQHENREYKCPICEKMFRSKLRLISHKSKYHTNKHKNSKVEKVMCEICDKKISKKHFKRHMDSIHGTNRPKYQCEICDKLFKSEIGIAGHIKIIHDNENVVSKCDICEKSFSRKAALDRHMKIHTNENKYKCDTCGVSFNQKCSLACHQVVHTKEKPFECGICGLKFTKKRQMKQHEKTHKEETVKSGIRKKKVKKISDVVDKNISDVVDKKISDVVDHSESPISDQNAEKVDLISSSSYECPYCEKKFRSQLRLTSHKSEYHKIKLKLKKGKKTCEICDKSILKKHFKRHVNNIHGTNRPKYQCAICDKVFKTENGRTGHIKTFHDIETTVHKCDTCEKSFSRKLVLNRHMKIHTDEKKYKCDTCGVSFNQKCTLTRHQVVHTGEKPFECEICGQRFTKKTHMKQHEKTHKEETVKSAIRRKKLKKICDDIDESESSGSDQVTIVDPVSSPFWLVSTLSDFDLGHSIST